MSTFSEQTKLEVLYPDEVIRDVDVVSMIPVLSAKPELRVLVCDPSDREAKGQGVFKGKEHQIAISRGNGSWDFEPVELYPHHQLITVKGSEDVWTYWKISGRSYFTKNEIMPTVDLVEFLKRKYTSEISRDTGVTTDDLHDHDTDDLEIQRNVSLVEKLLVAYSSPVVVDDLPPSPLNTETELTVATLPFLVVVESSKHQHCLHDWVVVCSHKKYTATDRLEKAKMMKNEIPFDAWGAWGKRWQLFCEYLVANGAANNKIRIAAKTAMV